MMRMKLPSRRPSVTLHLTVPFGGNDVEFGVTFGYGVDYSVMPPRLRVSEVFCAPFRIGTDMRALARQDAIVMSVGLQHGISMEELQRVLGEDQPEPARSIIGAIVRVGANLDREQAA